MRNHSRVPFVDREQELAELHELADRPGPALILLYGRRRVGKTYLLERAWPDRRVFYFLAADSTAEMNRSELLRELAAWSDRPLDPQDYPTWRTVFRLLVDLASDSPMVVVLDEFQYLMGQSDELVSQLVAIWDREVRGRRLTLALSGSEVATMEHLLDGGRPLYGRTDWSARLRPFDYRDTAKMVPDRTPREAAMVYGIFGGTPRYLASARTGESLGRWVTRSLLSPRGEVHLQLQNIVEQEKGIRDPAEYRAVLAATASGRTALNEIALAAGMQDRPYIVRHPLEVLEKLGLVARERNFAAPRKEPYRYRITDNAVRFWYEFVYVNRSRLEVGDPAEVWVQQVQPHLNEYMGRVFEGMCREAYLRYHTYWQLPSVATWSRWEGRDRNRRSIEIDIVARTDDDRVLTGEIKWSSHRVGSELHSALTRSLEDLSRSGYSWAREALTPEKSTGRIYFSAAGFTDSFRTEVADRADILLISLDDLYPPA